jgi:Leucine-rich repeat (LRR) protein
MINSGVSFKKTKFLYLMDNKFQTISNYTFINVSSIEMINLDNNLIQNVEPLAFYSLVNFRYLSLKNNSIKVIYDFMFSSDIQFHLSGNNITLIYENSFKHISSLYLDYSSLISFKDLNYCYFSMRNLYLGNQRIDKLFENTIKGFYSKIFLDNNLLTSSSFENFSFGYLPNLTEISFAKNIIGSLDFNDAFQFNMTNVKSLNFENNKISTTKRVFFSKFSNLNVLLLSNNNFGSLKNYYFTNLERLEHLNLSNNQILTIEEKTFEKLTSLLNLNLKNNLIYDLSQTIFSNLSRLEILSLSENKLESIEKDYFKGLNNLKYLDLSNNQIKIIYKDSFSFVPNLENLNLRSNLIANLNISLRMCKYLRNLDLSFNKLKEFKDFDVSSNITSLDLSYNPLKQFEFNVSNFFSLKSLKLSHSNSRVVSNINFERLLQLEELDLSDNFNINTKQFKYLINLKILNIKNTNTSDCSFISSLKSIEELDVSKNKNYYACFHNIRNNLKILKMSNISFKGMINDISLNIKFYYRTIIYFDASYNNISTIDGINELIDLTHLDLKLNMIGNINIDSHTYFNFHKLSKLEFINLNQSFASNLKNFELKFGIKLERAILSWNGLRVFPKFCEQDDTKSDLSEFSCNLRILYFDHNELDKIERLNLISLESLEYFNLHSNEISVIEDNLFFNLKSLETLILSNNKINLANNTEILFSALTNIILLDLSSNCIELIQRNTFSNLLKLELLDLSNNKIRLIKENLFNGLISLRDLYINKNEPNMKIENSSFNQFESIKNIFIDKSILNDSLHKRIFIEMTENKNILDKNNKTILKWNYYPSFNLIALNETSYDCHLVFEFIKFNIQYNLRTESDYSNYLSNCQIMKIIEEIDNISQEDDKLEINYLYLFFVMLGCIILLLLIWALYLLVHNPNAIRRLVSFTFRLKNFFKVTFFIFLNSMSNFRILLNKLKNLLL